MTLAPLRRALRIDHGPFKVVATMGERKRSSGNGRRIKDLHAHPSPYVTIAELAEYWLVSRKQIYKQVEAGTLKAIRLGPRLLRISTADAIQFERVARMEVLRQQDEDDDDTTP